MKVVRTIDKNDRSIQVVRFNFLFASSRGDRRARSRTRVLGANDDDDDDDGDDATMVDDDDGLVEDHGGADGVRQG